MTTEKKKCDTKPDATREAACAELFGAYVRGDSHAAASTGDFRILTAFQPVKLTYASATAR